MGPFHGLRSQVYGDTLMPSVGLEIAIVLLLVFINGIFSLSELAIVSARKNRLQDQADDGSRGAQVALRLSENPTRFLSTVQIGITLIGIMSGAFGGATLAETISRWLSRFPQIAPYSDGLAVALVVLVITYLSLVIGELVPKKIALNNAEAIATRMAPLMLTLSKITTPLVWLLTISTEFLVKLTGIRPSSDPAVTEDDVRSMMSQGTQIGIFEESEQEIVNQVFRLGERRVSTVMTPRTQIVMLDKNDPPQTWIDTIVNSEYARLPVIDESPDNVVGIIEARRLLFQVVAGETARLEPILEAAQFLPEAMTAMDALNTMKQSGAESALVIDEYGGLSGVVTFRDLMEALVGDLDETQSGLEPDVLRREDGTLLLDGQLMAEDVKEILRLDQLPDEGRGYYETLGGLIMYILGRVPDTGETLQLEDFRLEIIDMDGRRIDKVLAERISTE